MHRFSCLIVLACVAVVPSILLAQTTVNVPVDDPVYRKIDKLISLGLIKDAIYGQRPWSRREIARLIAEAKENKDLMEMPMAPDDRELSQRIAAEDIIAVLEPSYKDELMDLGALPGEAKSLHLHPLSQVSLDLTGLHSPSRPVPLANGLGNIDAFVNPLVAYRDGRHYADGFTLGLETVHYLNSKYFSVYARPRFEVLAPSSGGADIGVLAQQLYGKFMIANVEIEAGRDELVWGHGRTGGVLASNNARPLDMIKLSNDHPFYHPWIFKYLGPSKYTFFVANLGPEYVFKDAFLYGLAVSIKPASFLELGVEHQVTVAGDGGPAIGVGDLASEFFLVRRSRSNGPNLADHRIGANIRFDIVPLRHTVLYLEGVFEDFGHASFLPQFSEQMAFQSGFYVPRLSIDGTDDLRVQYEHVPPAYGRHSSWSSGLTLNRRLRGSETGPDGQTVTVEWNHDFSPKVTMQNIFAYHNRDGDLYTVTLSPSGGSDRVVKTTNNPTEHRLHYTNDLLWDVSSAVRLEFEFGYEYVHNFGFVRGQNRNNVLGGLTVTLRPEELF